MKTVLSLLGIILFSGISLSAQQSSIPYAEYEKQLADYQGRDQQLREQIALEQSTILDVKNRIASSRKRIDDLHRKKLETLGITADDVDATLQLFDLFTQEVTAVINLPETNFRNDSLKAAGFRGRLDTLLSYPACRLKSFSALKLSASELVGEIEKRLQKLAAAPVVKILQQAPSPRSEVLAAEKVAETASVPAPVGTATYVVRNNEGRAETLFDIAQQVYGNAYLWPRIYEANKKMIEKNFNRYRKGPARSRIADPSDLIYPGQLLAIPR